MSVPAAYLTVVVVWSTTPLAVVWSNETLHPTLTVMLRMAIAAVAGLALLRLLRMPLHLNARALHSYVAGVPGVFGAMTLTYLAVAYIPSGLISVIFGLSPIFSSWIAQLWLGEQPFTLRQWFAMGVALSGLMTIFGHDFAIGDDGDMGLMMMVCAMLLFSISGVWLKRVSGGLHPMAQTVGTLWVALPCFLVSWWLQGAPVPDALHLDRSAAATLYLALMGSLLGFFSYYYVLQHMSASRATLITLITPVFALALGHWFNAEPLTRSIVIGASLILIGLVLFTVPKLPRFLRLP